jgi:sirohydrochlorin cobaltochelatase
MPDAIEKALSLALNDACCFGQISISKKSKGFSLSHREDVARLNLQVFCDADDAIEIARSDDAGNYRPLKTAPSLRHGWRLEVADTGELRRALDYFYPGRLAMLSASNANRLTITTLRETLNRQSGMYRVAAKITDEQIDEVVGNFCKSNGGCLRTILWKRDQQGASPSTKLPAAKFDLAHDQTGRGERAVPLLCQEACALLVNECRMAVKGESAK